MPFKAGRRGGGILNLWAMLFVAVMMIVTYSYVIDRPAAPQVVVSGGNDGGAVDAAGMAESHWRLQLEEAEREITRLKETATQNGNPTDVANFHDMYIAIAEHNEEVPNNAYEAPRPPRRQENAAMVKRLGDAEAEIRRLKLANSGGGGGKKVATGVAGAVSVHPYHGDAALHIEETATPAEVSLVHRVLTYVTDHGLSATKKLLDGTIGNGENLIACAKEKGPNMDCKPVKGCENEQGVYTVRYGLPDRHMDKTFQSSDMPAKCTGGTFGRDPAGGYEKSCWIVCSRERNWVRRDDACSAVAPPFQQWARSPLCGRVATASTPWEKALQQGLEGFCLNPKRMIGFNDLWVDCKYKEAAANALGITNQGWNGVITQDMWIDKAWVSFFKGSDTGMTHSMMVSNLIRSVHFFSEYPVIVFCVGTPKLSLDWDPKVFPRLIVIHVDEIQTMTEGKYISFNFNKFRSMLIRVKNGVQLDADMIIGPYADRLFAGNDKWIGADYPYPIMPVHWMTRYREEGVLIDGYPVYAIGYPKDWPPRIRWAHCHPTWTWHTLPFMGDALMAKIDFREWSTNPRVVAALGPSPKPNPPQYMGEDEDLLNILLWRYKALRQWCKWDPDPGVYEEFLDQKDPDPMRDSRWYPNGIPKVFVGIHNTKNTVDTDLLLTRMLREDVPKGYLHFNHKFYDGPESFLAENDMKDAPCLLV